MRERDMLESLSLYWKNEPILKLLNKVTLIEVVGSYLLSNKIISCFNFSDCGSKKGRIIKIVGSYLFLFIKDL